jgi:hypothetical protein
VRLARVAVDVFKLLTEVCWGVDILGLVLLLPNGMQLILTRLDGGLEERQHLTIAFVLVLPQHKVGRRFLDFANYVDSRVLTDTLNDHVYVIRHDNKRVKLDLLQDSSHIQAIDKDAFDHGTPENVCVLHGACGDEVQVIGIDVYWPAC